MSTAQRVTFGPPVRLAVGFGNWIWWPIGREDAGGANPLTARGFGAAATLAGTVVAGFFAVRRAVRIFFPTLAAR